MKESYLLTLIIVISLAETIVSFQPNISTKIQHVPRAQYNTQIRVPFQHLNDSTTSTEKSNVICNLVEGADAAVSLSPASIIISNVLDFAVSNINIELQSLTSGALCGMGDILAQTKEYANKDENSKPKSSLIESVNLNRTGRLILKGLGSGLIWYQWYALADVLSEDFVSSVLHVSAENNVMVHATVRTISAILLEQFIACPIIFALWDLPLPSLLDGTDLKTIPGQVKGKLGTLLIENAKVWSFANLLLYNIPLEWRVAAMNIADVYWQSVYSGIAMKESSESLEALETLAEG